MSALTPVMTPRLTPLKTVCISIFVFVLCVHISMCVKIYRRLSSVCVKFGVILAWPVRDCCL